MNSPWNYKDRPSIFATDKNFNGGNEKKKVFVSDNESLKDRQKMDCKTNQFKLITKRKETI